MDRSDFRRLLCVALWLAALAVPWAASAEAQAGGDGAPPPAMTAPAAPPAAEPGAAAAAAPARGDRIIYQVLPVVTGDGSTLTTRIEAVPILASTGAPLLGADLYRQLGRPDLVAAFEARQARRGVLAAVGGAVVLGGMIYATTRPGPDVTLPPDEFDRAMDAQARAQLRGELVALGGGVLLAVAAFTDPNPVDEAERRRLVDEHDRALDRRGEAPGPRPAAPRLVLDAGLLPGGAIAQVGLAF